MRKVRKLDLHAPRHYYKAYNVYNEPFYKKLIEKYPKFKDYKFGELKKIISEFHKIMIEQVIENRDGVELSGNLGQIFIGSCKKENEVIDYKKSAELGVAVQHRNLKSDDFLAKIFFTTFNSCGYKFNELWGFKGSRFFTRLTSRMFATNWNRYIKFKKLIKQKN